MRSERGIGLGIEKGIVQLPQELREYCFCLKEIAYLLKNQHLDPAPPFDSEWRRCSAGDHLDFLLYGLNDLGPLEMVFRVIDDLNYSGTIIYEC